VAIIRWRSDFLEGLVLADSPIVIFGTDGGIDILRDGRHETVVAELRRDAAQQDGLQGRDGDELQAVSDAPTVPNLPARRSDRTERQGPCSARSLHALPPRTRRLIHQPSWPIPVRVPTSLERRHLGGPRYCDHVGMTARATQPDQPAPRIIRAAGLVCSSA
jgi:hypothetical protein